MRWLTRLAASQRNIDCVAKWFGGTVPVLAVLLAVVLQHVKFFK